MKDKLYLILGYSGLIPFVGFAALSFSNWFLPEQITVMQIGYALMISSFLGGMHWLRAVKVGCPFYLGLSLIPSVLGLGVLIFYALTHSALALIGAAILLILNFIIDRRALKKADDIPPEFMRFRFILTGLASLSVLITFLGLITVADGLIHILDIVKSMI